MLKPSYTAAKMLHACIGVALLVGLALPAAGATNTVTDYPSKPIQWIIPFPAGGNSDQSTKILLPYLKKYMKDATIEPVYQAGNSGITAANVLNQAPSDGYTLMLGRVSNIAIGPAQAGATNYTWRDFTVLSLIEANPLICAVAANSPYQKPRDLINHIRKNPGTVKYPSVGRTTITDLSTLYWMRIAGLKRTDVKAVPVKGGDDDALSVIDGRTDFVCVTTTTLVPEIKKGRLRGLFTTAPGRLVALPDLPNASEAGFRDMANMLGWSVLVGPKKMPAPVVQKWRDAMRLATADPAWQAEAEKQGWLVLPKIQKNAELFLQEQSRIFEDILGDEVAFKK